MNKLRLVALTAGVIALAVALPAWFYLQSGQGQPAASAGPEASVAPPDQGQAPASVNQSPIQEQPAAQVADAAGTAPDKNSRLESSLASLARLAPQDEPAIEAFAAARGLALEDGRVRTVLEAGPSGTAQAETAATDVGGKVEATAGNLVQALVPIDRLADLAASDSISLVRPPHRPDISAVTSEGLTPMNVPAWQTAGQQGAGAKVAVLDPGFKGYTDRIASGDLPNYLSPSAPYNCAVNAPGCNVHSFRANGDITGGGEVHGVACAEIVYDVAPGAQLYLVNFNTEVELSNAVDWLISQHVDVISTSWGFFGGWPGDGTGAVDDIVQRARNNGILWTSSAGNLGQAHWTGRFNDTTGDGWNKFSGGDETDSFTVNTNGITDIYLSWNRWPVTDQDYDLFLYKSGNPNPVAASTGPQSGTQAPEEEIVYDTTPGAPAYGAGTGTYYLKIQNFHASGDANLSLYSYPYNLAYRVSRASLAGAPTDAPAAVTVGAVPYYGTTIESFSSQGPTNDGRVKPDVTGYDRVTTATYGLQAFGGTSAASPHAAGEATLIKAVNPGWTPAQIQNLMEGQALDLGTAGKDYVYGSGRLHLTQPLVGNVLPGGTIYTTATTISADYADINGSGLNLGTVAVALDGSPLAGCTVAASGVSCPAAGLAPGHHTVSVTLNDNSGNPGAAAGGFDIARDYYWTWYDGVNSSNWIMMANPAAAVRDLNFNLSIDGMAASLTPFTLPGAGPGQLPPGRTLVTAYPGSIGGPVKDTSLTGSAAILSQRVIWGASSLEELPGTDAARLASHFYWPWYDQQSPGYNNWVMVSNPSSETVHADVSFTDLGGTAVTGGKDIAPGLNWTPTFPGKIGGPVEVKAYLAGPGHSWPANARNVMTSQRVLTGNGSAFNEVSGTPEGELSDRYLWTWYDEQSPGARDWVMVTNPAGAAASVYYRIDIGGGCEVPGGNKACLNGGPLAAGKSATPEFPGVANGPVEIRSCSVPLQANGNCSGSASNVIASQRSLWGPSFEEVPGLAASTTGGFSALSSTYNWTWYDQRSAGAQNWVMVSNPGPGSAYYEVTIGASTVPVAFGTLGSGQNATPSFPGTEDGPVKVQAWTSNGKSTPANVIASQRVLWKGYFNEVLGMTLN